MNDDGTWYRALGPARRPSGHPDYSLIDESLYVGEYPTPDDAAWLRDELAVGAVVNLQDEMDIASKFLRRRDLEEAYARHDIVFHHLPLPDGDGERLYALLDPGVALLRELIERGLRVYLHCNAGMNRAPSLAIAYLHVVRNLPLGEACLLMKTRRSCLPYQRVLEARYGPV